MLPQLMLYQTIQASGLSDMIASAGSLSEPTQNTIQTFAALDKRYVQVGLKCHGTIYCMLLSIYVYVILY